MYTISSNDLVQVYATFCGRTIASISSTGFESIQDVLKAIRKAVGTFAGMVKLSVRNASQGWRQQRAFFIAPVPPGTQLTLF